MDHKSARLHYIDIAKGILILMVVWGHYELMLRLCFKVNDQTIDHWDSIENLWVSFFMPAFFFITGFCTNFHKPFKPFLVSGIKTLLIPAIIINYSINTLEYLSWGWSIKAVVGTVFKSIIKTCAGEWFIPSLFISRIIVWGLVRLEKNWLELTLSLFLFLIGVCLYNLVPSSSEIWYYKHALMVIPFVIFGVKLKLPSLERLSSITYILLLFIVIAIGNGIPYITNRVSVAFWEIPIVLMLALSGTFMILYVSKRINTNKVLEFLGRNSLVIYLAHFGFYRLYLSACIGWFNLSGLISTTLFFGVIITNVLTCSLLAYILNTSHLKWILGKF